MYFRFYFIVLLCCASRSFCDEFLKKVSSIEWQCVDEKCTKPISVAKPIQSYIGDHEVKISFRSHDGPIHVLGKPVDKNEKLWLISVDDTVGVAPYNLLKELKLLNKPADNINLKLDFSKIIAKNTAVKSSINPTRAEKVVDGTTLPYGFDDETEVTTNESSETMDSFDKNNFKTPIIDNDLADNDKAKYDPSVIVTELPTSDLSNITLDSKQKISENTIDTSGNENIAILQHTDTSKTESELPLDSAAIKKDSEKALDSESANGEAEIKILNETHPDEEFPQSEKTLDREQISSTGTPNVVDITNTTTFEPNLNTVKHTNESTNVNLLESKMHSSDEKQTNFLYTATVPGLVNETPESTTSMPEKVTEATSSENASEHPPTAVYNLNRNAPATTENLNYKTAYSVQNKESPQISTIDRNVDPSSIPESLNENTENMMNNETVSDTITSQPLFHKGKPESQSIPETQTTPPPIAAEEYSSSTENYKDTPKDLAANRFETSPGPQASSEPSPEPQASSETTLGPQASSETTPGLQAFSETTPGLRASSETTPGPQASSESTPGLQAFSETTPGLQASSETTPEPQASSETSPELKASSEPPMESQASSETSSELQASNEPPMEPHASSETTLEPHASSETTPEPQASTETTPEPRTSSETPRELPVPSEPHLEPMTPPEETVDIIEDSSTDWFSPVTSIITSLKEMFTKSDIGVDDSQTIYEFTTESSYNTFQTSHEKTGVFEDSNQSCEKDGFCNTFPEVSEEASVPFSIPGFEGSGVSGSSLIYAIVTSSVILLFSLGYYYVENLKRDSELIAKINSLSAELFFAQKELTTMEEQISTTSENFEKLATNKTVNDEELNKMKQDLEETKAVNTGLTLEIKRLEKEIESLVESNDEMHKMLTESITEEDRTQSLLANIADLKSVLSGKLDEIASVTDQLDKEKQEVELLTIALQKTEEQKENLEEKLQKVLNEIDSKALAVTKEFEEKVTSLEKIIEETSLVRTNFEKELCELKAECDKLAAEKELSEKSLKKAQGIGPGKALSEWLDTKEVRVELIATHKEVEKLRRELDEAKEHESKLQEQKNELQLEIETINNNYETAEKTKIETLTKLQVLSNYFKEKETQLQEELGDREAQWLTKQSEDHTIYEQMRSLREENLSYRAQNEALKKEILDQEASFKIQIANEEQKSQENWVTLRHTERRLKEVQMEAAHLRSRLTAMETNPDSLDDKHKSLELVNGEVGLGPGSPPFMLYPPPPPDFIPPPPLVSPSRPPPLGRLSSPPLTPPPPLSPYDLYPSPPAAPSPPTHRGIIKPHPRDPVAHRKQKESQSSNHSSESMEKPLRRGKR